MRRDEDWFDAVGKDDWRVEQIEKREKERNDLQEKERLSHGRIHHTEGKGLPSQESDLLKSGIKDGL